MLQKKPVGVVTTAAGFKECQTASLCKLSTTIIAK